MTLETTRWGKIHAVSLARAFSAFGTELTTFTVVMRERGLGSGLVATLFIVGTLPLILFGPWSGWLADRFSTRQLVPVVNLVSAIAVLSLTQQQPLWLLIATLFIYSAMSGISAPAWGALVPTLCKPDDLSRVQGLSQSYFAFAGLLAPAAAGLLVTSTGYFWTFVIDAVSFFVIAASPFIFGVNRAGQTPEHGEKVKVMEGYRVVLNDRLIRSLVILVFVFIAAIGVMNVADIFFMTKVLNATPFQYGLVGTAFAVGSLAGAALASAVKVPLHRQALMSAISMATLGLAFLFISLMPTWWPILIFMTIAGVSNSGLNSWAVGLTFAKADPASRGRLAAAIQSLFSVASVGALVVGGVTISWIGAREVMTIGAAVSLLALAIFTPSLLKANRLKFDAQ